MKKDYNGKWITKLDYTGLTDGLFELAPRWVHITNLGNAPICEIAAKEIEASPAQYPWQEYATGFFEFTPNFRSDKALTSAALKEYWLPAINQQTGEFCPFKARELGQLMAEKYYAWQAITKDVSHFDGLMIGYIPPEPKSKDISHRAIAFAIVMAYRAGKIKQHIWESKEHLKDFIQETFKYGNPQRSYIEKQYIVDRFAKAKEQHPNDYELGQTLYFKHFN